MTSPTAPPEPQPLIDRRTARRLGTKAEIVAAAWALVRESGLAGLSLRDLGARVGMKAQSIYSYFASKDEIYDAMFVEGYREFIDWMDDGVAPKPGTERDLVDYAKERAHRFFAFCVTDPARYQLLFQRTIPGFEPSPESYAVAVDALQRGAQSMGLLGLTDPHAIDLWTAVLTGLADQQISNDPGGDRWEQLVDRAVEMLIAETAPEILTTRRSER
jgi:AcrR family transcriptional regulator